MIRFFMRHFIPLVALALFAVCYYAYLLSVADFNVARSAAQVLAQEDHWNADALHDALTGFVLTSEDNRWASETEGVDIRSYGLAPRGRYHIWVYFESESGSVTRIRMDYNNSDPITPDVLAKAEDRGINWRYVGLGLAAIVPWYVFLYMPDRGISTYLRWIPFSVTICVTGLLSLLAFMATLIDILP